MNGATASLRGFSTSGRSGQDFPQTEPFRSRNDCSIATLGSGDLTQPFLIVWLSYISLFKGMCKELHAARACQMYTHHPDIILTLRYFTLNLGGSLKLDRDVPTTVWILDSVYYVNKLLGLGSVLKQNLFIIEGPSTQIRSDLFLQLFIWGHLILLHSTGFIEYMYIEGKPSGPEGHGEHACKPLRSDNL